MKSKPTGQILLDWGLVTPAQLDAAMEAQKGLPSQEALGDTLVNMGIISERDKLRCLAEQWGCRFVDLDSCELSPDTVKLLSQEIARRYKAIPISRSSGRVVLAMKEPNDIYAIDHIRVILGSDVEPVMALEEEILTTINRFHNSDTNVSEVISDALKDVNLDSIEVAVGGKEEDVSVEALRELVEVAPIVRLANLIIS